MTVRRTCLAALLAIVLGYEAWTIFWRPLGTPANPAGPRPLVIGEVAGPNILTQIFFVGIGGLSTVTVHPRRWQSGASGPVVFRLFRVDPDELVADARVDAANVLAHETFTFTFPPIWTSTRVAYRLEIGAPDAGEGEGLAFLASRQPTYAEGVLQLAGRERWGDLAFSTTAVRGTLARYTAIGPDGATTTPRIVGVAALLAVLNVVLVIVVRDLIVGRASERDGALPHTSSANRR